MAYSYNKGITKSIADKLKNFRTMALTGLAFTGLAFSFVPGVSARGGTPTTKVVSVVACSSASVTFTVNTTSNDKVNSILVQADGNNVLIRTVPRRAVTTITVDGSANTNWSFWRQERDSWLPDYNTVVQFDGTCGPNTWL